MAKSSKRLPKPAVKRRASSTPGSGEKAKPFLHFCHSIELRTKTLRLLDTLEHAPDPEKHRDALADIVVELTYSGLDFYFMKPLKLAKAGMLTEQFANIGMAGGLQILGSVIRTVIGRMETPQLLSVCQSVRQLMN